MEVTKHLVERVARIVVDDSEASLLDWTVRPMGGGLTEEVGFTGGLRRISGRVAVAERAMEWPTRAGRRASLMPSRFSDAMRRRAATVRLVETCDA